MCGVITLRNTQRILRFAEIMLRDYSCGQYRQFDYRDFISNMGGVFGINNTQGYKARIFRVIDDVDTYFSLTVGREPTEAEQRSLVAHAIGHAVLHLGAGWDDAELIQRGVYVDSTLHRINHLLEDWEADLFGHALSMPKLEFQEVALHNCSKSGDFDIAAIAKHFGVAKKSVLLYGRSLLLFGTVRDSAVGA